MAFSDLEVQSQSPFYPCSSLDSCLREDTQWVGKSLPWEKGNKEKKLFLFFCSRKTEAPLNEEATFTPQ